MTMGFGTMLLVLPALVVGDGQLNTSYVSGALALTVTVLGDVSSLGPA